MKEISIVVTAPITARGGGGGQRRDMYHFAYRARVRAGVRIGGLEGRRNPVANTSHGVRTAWAPPAKKT
eukprot:5393135-Prymnesium_polylepis.1